MEKMIQTAADKGLMGICFTEHFDPDYPDTPENLDFSLNIPAYRQKLESLADAFKNQIQVNFGIELGLQPQLAESFSDLLKEVPFDFVIGSSHVVHGYDPYYPSYFEGRKESACYMEYFESILENFLIVDDMDVYECMNAWMQQSHSRIKQSTPDKGHGKAHCIPNINHPFWWI